MVTDERAVTIVMVDDNMDEIFLTRRLLRNGGVVNHFISEKDPRNVFRCLDNIIVNGAERSKIMVLLDLNMGGMNGLDVLDQIRKNPRYKSLTVIILSGSDNEADMLECYDRGADGYIVKPFKNDEFFAALSNVGDIRYQLVQ